MTATPNLGLLEIPQNSLNLAPPHNQSVQVLDIAVNLSAIDNTVTTPPTTVAGDAGKRWIVPAAGASGDWTGKANQIAYCVGAGLWAFLAAKEGWYCPITSGTNIGKVYKFIGGVWVEAVVGGSLGAASITYDNSTSGLTASNAQTAIDEVDGKVDLNAAKIAAVEDQTDLVALSISSGTVAIDLSAAGFFTLLLNANVTAWTITGAPPAGKAGSWAIRIRQDATGGRTVALPSSFKATGGSDSAVASAANAYTLLTFTTFDGGTRYEFAMQDIAA